MILRLPKEPGVYIFKDKEKKPLYIGKAINIEKRVKDHFKLKNCSYKEKKLLEKTTKVESIRVDSEIEALLLEANLIKKYKPIYNEQWKDDKDYLYIKITSEEFPRVVSARKKSLVGAKAHFGPFPQASKVRTTLKTLRRIFPYSTCKPNQKRPCLAYHLNLCPGVCSGQIGREEYKRNIRALTLFLQGKKTKVREQFSRQVRKNSKNLEFEEAEKTQRKIEALNYVTRPVRSTSEYLEEDIRSIREKEMMELAREVSLEKKPGRIECYDISNIQGRNAVGSMVVFTDGNPDKDEYRRFKIRKISGINDPAMIGEVLERRFKNPWAHPDLLVVDGGKPQFGAAKKVMERLGLKIPVISLAKRLEEIYFGEEGRALRLPAKSNALKLVQRLRDEAHRFAITYHRKLRSNQFLTSK
jgi:excinuclease ABC subunit C